MDLQPKDLNKMEHDSDRWKPQTLDRHFRGRRGFGRVHLIHVKLNWLNCIGVDMVDCGV